MKRLGIALVAAGLASFAHAADLPRTKAPEKAKPNCWASVWDWLNTSAADCPIGAYGVTLYGTLDLNATYLHDGVDKNPAADKVNYSIQRNAFGSRWLAGYNGLSTTVIGLKMKEDLARVGLPGWSLIGVLEAGVNPYSGMFFNGPRSLASNNARPAGTFPFQNANFDGSRAGQWDNSQGYLGISNPVYGTLTFGRTNSLALDVTSAYDPVASTAFSTLGFSAAFAGFGTSPTARPNTAFTYRLTYQNFRAAVQAQIGGYGIGNATNGMYQGQLGFDFGSLSIDGVLSWAKDAVSLSSFAGSNIACLTPANCFINVNNQFFDPNTVLRATLSNNLGGELVAKYKWDPFTFYGGWIYARQMNPSDDFLTGFPTIAQGIFIPPGFISKGVLTNNAVTINNFDIQRVLNTFWTAARWKIRSDLEAMVGFYYQNQNNFNPGACTGSSAFISSSRCGGSQDGISFLLDWKPVKRVDIYAGVLVSNVYGGLANGFFSTSTAFIPGTTTAVSVNTARTQNYDPTVGIRIRF
ncbi:MAG TPA: porin [Roseiarcus sp.]|jgi:predicted porin|nr:porin [Roseiarcus sp.]